ncbi:protein trichome birefringence-like 10 [Dorcoceras hygrometricum]|uniref:Protein trichome birefringence-like 10 n=1 Tax=Dorcoceras hygrometricum TaxID=472368 RepID=A0A2Z7BGL3_9LAMI|nr:protein trichome birefringence-like 10 [Dorcoceras hygrometricum]
MAKNIQREISDFSNSDCKFRSEYFRFEYSGYFRYWVKYSSYRVKNFRSEGIRFDSEATVLVGFGPAVGRCDWRSHLFCLSVGISSNSSRISR